MTAVSQGRHLGPLLFIVLRKNADDLKIFRPITSISQAVYLQQDLDVLTPWLQYNNLALNKCAVVSFQRKTSETIYIDYRIGNMPENRVKEMCELVGFSSMRKYRNNENSDINE